MGNALYFGDNLHVLRDEIKAESIDLIYLDPPFNSSATYNVLFKSPKGDQSHAQIEAFEDTWHWGEQAEKEYAEILHQPNTDVAEMIQALRKFLGENDMMAYLTMMCNRLLELHRVLKPTGSLYLHCDPTASHYLKIVLDGVFGKENFQNEISWLRSSTRSSISKIYRRAHDIIFFYTKSDTYTYNMQFRELSSASIKLYSHEDENGLYQPVPLLVSGRRKGETGKVWKGIDPNTRGKDGMHWVTTPTKLEEYDAQGLVVFPQKESGVPRLKYYLHQSPGVPMNDFWDDVDLISSSATESMDYPTQKPLVLLDRIINTSSNEGDIVLDPFCGCGTAVHSAEQLRRKWIGIDITHLAVSLIEKRMKDAFPGIKFEVHGTPKDIDGAKDLAIRDKYQFQWWACSLVNAQPYQGKKKGADSGIDGLIFFHEDDKTVGKIIVSVKGGDNISVAMVRDLVGVVEREKAQMGFFVTLTDKTKPMDVEATKAGYYTSPVTGKAFPKMQILTIDGLMNGTERPIYPDLGAGGLTFKQASKADKKEQKGLF